ncbi:MAG: ABC transporter substrate-binding protein [Lachnospiraceae bacterium]|jgi:putative aldouronate transport system substrate-binding protein|nr:ABC transporter substrate-binding protein [uncultured Acetatifactor sp.]MCI9571222.1 ABC transporter substrate-binding protein [Lachnospiraceae bacterium]
MKKRTCKIMALLLACGMLAGCGSKPQETSKDAQEAEKNEQGAEESGQETESSSNAEQEEAQQEASGETVNIKWYVTNNNGDENPDKPEIEAAINEYIEPRIGVTVSMINPKEEPELPLALASGEDIDLFWTANWANGNNYISGNSAMDLTDLLPDYPDLYGSMPENIWQAAQQGGRNYYVPIYKEAAVGHGFVYSTEKAAENGWDFSDVKSYADLTPFLKEAYEKGATNAWLPVSNSWMAAIEDVYAMLPICSTDGILGIRIDEGTTVENLIESDLFKEHAALMYEWNQAGYINPERAASTLFSFEEIGQLMVQGDTVCAMWTTVPDNIANASLRYGVPVGTLLESKNYLSNGGTFGSAYMVNARTEKADACLKFLGLLSTDQTLADLLCYGIEGKHYTRDAEGYVTVNADAGWKNSVWSCCNVMVPSLQKGESADKKEQYDVFNRNAEMSILAHFLFDDSKVEAECAAVNAVCGEYFRLLDTGFYNPDEYLPKFQKALKDAGIDKIVEEAQAQYDAYRSQP